MQKAILAAMCIGNDKIRNYLHASVHDLFVPADVFNGFNSAMGEDFRPTLYLIFHEGNS